MYIGDINEDQYQPTIASGDVVISFYMDGCPSCNKFKPVFEEVVSRFAQDVTIQFAMMNAHTYRDISSSLGIHSVPFTIFFKNGVAQSDQIKGCKDLSTFSDWINRHHG